MFLMRGEKEEKKEQARSNKQGKATQHTQGSHFPRMYMYNLEWKVMVCYSPQYIKGVYGNTSVLWLLNIL